MTGPSVLEREAAATGAPEADQAPACFADLNLDQVVAAITTGRAQYDLRPFFHTPLADAADVAYRHEVFRDLEDRALRGHVAAFAKAMRGVRAHTRRADTIRNVHLRRRLQLDAASAYCTAVSDLAKLLANGDLGSRGLRDFSAYLRAYVRSPGFATLQDDVSRLGRDLDSVTYRITILEDRVRVRRASEQCDYGEAIERTFRKFRRPTSEQRVTERPATHDVNHVEAAILELVTRLYPGVFSALERFAARHATYLDPAIARFEREVQFYLAYIDYVQGFEGAGLRFCYPEVSRADKEVRARDAFDVALAQRLLQDEGTIVRNDFRLDGAERVFVVTGANQGGKSTFARMFGQLHFLAALGCPVPGREARLFLCDELLTHFEKEEDLRTLQGRLQDELTRMHALLDRATPRSIVIMNEAFTSTAADDALYLGRETLERLLDLDALGVYVTFVDELASLDARIVSVTATVDPVDPVKRTFEIVRRPPDGRAHALAIAQAYGLTYDQLRLRLQP